MADLAELRAAVLAAITGIAPVVAPSRAFFGWDDPMVPLHQGTEGGRTRGIVVKSGTVTQGEEAYGAATASYKAEIIVRIGYPLGDTEEISGSRVDVDDLKASDLEEIDTALCSTALPAAVSGVKLVRLSGAREAYGGRCREIVYEAQYTREQ